MPDNAQETEPSPPPKPGLRRLALLLILLVAIGLILSHLITQLLPKRVTVEAAKPPTPVVENQRLGGGDVAVLNARIAQLEGQVKALENAVNAANPDARIHALQDKVNALQEHSSAANDATVQALSARLDAVEAENRRQIAMLTVFDPLKAALMHGAPFATELTQLTQMAQGDSKLQELLKPLAPYAASGIAAPAQLHNDFETLVPRALAAHKSPHSLMGNLESLIRIRKVGEQPGNDDEAIIARSEARLNRGDIEASARALAGLSPQAAGVFAPWIGKAQAWLQVQCALEALQMALLAPPPPPSAPAAPPAPAAAAPPAPATPQPSAPTDTL